MKPPADGFFLEDRAETRGIDWRLLRRLLRYVIPHRGILGCALAALGLGTACQLAGPYIIKIVIDRHVTPGVLPGMAGWILLYLAALAGAMGFLYLQMYAVSVLGQRVILSIRKEMFSRVQRLPVAWFDRTPTGRLMTRLTSDVEALQELISSGLVTTVGDAAVLAGTAAILLWMDTRLALVVFSVLPFLALFVELLKKRIRTANREARRKLARLNAFLQEHVTGAAVLKAFGQEGKSDRRFDALNADYLAENLRLTNYYSVFFPGVELFASFAVALLLWRGGEGLISGAITFGTLVAFLEYAQKFYNPIKDMSDKYNILQSALASSERIFQLLDAEVSPEYAEPVSGGHREGGGTGRRSGGRRPRDRVPRRLVLVPAHRRRRVRERGAGAAGPSGGVLRAGGGTDGGVRGGDGIGKDHGAFPAVPFLRDPAGADPPVRQGHTGHPRAGAARNAFPRAAGAVPFLGIGPGERRLGGPQRATPPFRRPGWTGSRRSGRTAFLTAVGERGGRLSMGQRQMVSIARALARDPKVLLLDEATSSVDPVTEHGIQEALPGILSGRTSLVVAHRLSTVLSADRIFVMHKGKVRETGTHEELMAAGGIYRRLHSLQFDY